MFILGGKTRAMQEQLDALQNEIGPLRVDRERIKKELGIERAADVISMIRGLESRIA